MNNQAYTMTPKQMKIDRSRRKIAQIKSDAFMLWHALYWRVLHFTKLAWPYSKTMCKFNLYRTFPDGRCMWCGNKHKGTKTEGEI